MIRKLSVVFIAILAAAPVAFAKDTNATVHFDKGASSKAISGSIKGYDVTNYLLGVGAGQTVVVQFSPGNSSCYFNVYEPGATDTAVFIGSSSGNEFSTNQAKAGSYRIQVYLYRNAARRGETCKYNISFEVTGASHGSAAAVPSKDAMRQACVRQVASNYGVKPAAVQLAPAMGASADGLPVWNGEIDKGAEGWKQFRCRFDKGGELTDVMAMTSDGE